MNEPLGWHERLYGRLLRLYPVEFRTRYGDEMIQLFGDQVRDSLGDSGRIGLLSLWARTGTDLVATALSEHGRERTVAHSLSAAPTPSIRAAGLLGITGGAILLVAFLPFSVIPLSLNWIRLLLFCLGAMAVIVVVHRRQVRVSPVLAWSGAAPAFLANAWYATMLLLALPSDHPFAGDFGFVWFLAGVAMWAADAWFGIVTLKLGVVSRLGSLALALSALSIIGIDRFGLVTGFPEPTLFSVLALSGVALNGIGWVLLGVDVATRRRPATPAPR